jgi:hypothetical protein
MLKKHTFSPNHKVVAGPHNYSPEGGSPGPAAINARGSSMHQASAEPAGGGAAGPAPQMFSNGGQPDIMGGGIRGTLSDYGNAIKQTAKDLVSTAKRDPVDEAQKQAQTDRNNATNAAIDNQS